MAFRSCVLSLCVCRRLTLHLNRRDSIYPLQGTFLALRLLLIERCVLVMSENIYQFGE